jgi:putative transposase
MPATRLRFQIGDHLRIKGADGSAVLWRVLERSGRSWKLEPVGGGDTKSLTDDDIRTLRCRNQLEHYACNPEGLPQAQAELLRKTFDVHKPEARNAAERRAIYCRRVDYKREVEHLSLERCFHEVPEEIFIEYRDKWAKEDHDLRVLRTADRNRRRHMPEYRELADPKSPVCSAPRPSTLEAWYRSWVEVGRDIRILIPLDAKKGNRLPRLTRDIYDSMKLHIETFYLTFKQSTLRYTYRQLMKELRQKDQYVSYETFRNYHIRNWSGFEDDRKRLGWRKAYLKHDVFRRTRPPEHALEEVEVDHCLIDLIIVDDVSGRPLGRPWLTVMLDRATRMIVGCHLSFEVPSFASLQRCLAHAFWPKGTDGLLLKNDWPCEGIPKRIFTDNGREFLSRSLERAERSLGFTIVNLPVRSPWLKGAIERIFGSMNLEVFNFEDGKTFSNTIKRGDYNSVEEAKLTLSEARQKILEWVVDDYHVTPHEALDHEAPLEAWYRKTDVNGVRCVSREDDLVQLLGYATLRPITRSGVRLLGLYYYCDELKDLRKERDGLSKRFEIRVDPFDIGVVRLLDDVNGVWLKVPCDRPELSVGVSMYQARVHIRTAKRMVKHRKVTEEDLYKARQRVKDESEQRLGDGNATTTAAKVARYALPNGQFMTPVAGLEGIRAYNDDTAEASIATTDTSKLPAAHVLTASPPAARIDLTLAVAERLSQIRKPQ